MSTWDPSRRRRFGALWLLVVVSTLTGPGSAHELAAQDAARSAVVVDYVAGEDLYLAIGASQGVQAGDTLALFRSQEPNSVAFAKVLVTGASRTRSVVVVLDGAARLARDEVVYVATSEGDANVGEARVSHGSAAVPTEPRSAPSVVSSSQVRPSARWSGRVSFEVAARENTVSWSGNLAGETRRRFATPVGRLTLRGTGLPGGWHVDANLRAEYRYADGPAAVTPATSIRAYGLSAENRFEKPHLDVRIGRFSNPFESYSGYWDGLLVRVGSERGGGVGVVAGLEPSRYDEGPSSETRKVSAFVDYSAGRGTRSYRTDASIHAIRGGNDPLADRTFVGWTQRATLGAVRVDQRLQVNRDEGTGTWSLTRLRLRGSVGLGPARLELGVGRSKPAFLRRTAGVGAPARDQANVGLTVSRRGIGASIRVGVTDRDGADRATTVSGSARASLGRVGLSAAAGWWSRSTMSTVSLSPGMDLRIGGSRTRLRYRYYRVDGLAPSMSHAVEIGTTVSLQEGLQVRVEAQQQWSPTYRGTRINTGLSKSF